MERLEELEKIGRGQLKELIERRETFVLYVRSEKDFSKIKEIFDVDVVFPELARTFGERVPFLWCDIDEVEELSELKVYFAPVVLFFKGGELVSRLEGIKGWAEYNRGLEELLC